MIPEILTARRGWRKRLVLPAGAALDVRRSFVSLASRPSEWCHGGVKRNKNKIPTLVLTKTTLKEQKV